jgi:hypothetical protein
MKYKSRFFASALATLRQLSTVTLVAAVFVALPVASNAQQTTSSIQGTVSDPNGSPVANAEIVVVHSSTGSTSRTSTNAAGYYVIRGLRVGGPYVANLKGSSSYGEE